MKLGSSVPSLLVLICSVAVAQQSQVANPAAEAVPNRPCVLVGGAVGSPTRLELHRAIRLSEAIELAGGASLGASTDVVVARSQGLSCYQEKREIAPACLECLPQWSPFPDVHIYKRASLAGDDETRNPYLRNGDVVTVAAVPMIYVVGNVARPQGLSFETGMTLTSVLKIVGGVLRDSVTKRVQIHRILRNQQHEEILVDLEKIRKHPEMDFVLEPFDIIEVFRKREHPRGGDLLSVGVVYPVRIVN